LADAALDSSPDVPLERRLDEVAPGIDASLRDVVAGPVDLLITGNEWAVHGRRPFTARYDGTDRWLRRVNVLADIRRTAGATPSTGAP
jgi:hypothetical protein